MFYMPLIGVLKNDQIFWNWQEFNNLGHAMRVPWRMVQLSGDLGKTPFLVKYYDFQVSSYLVKLYDFYNNITIRRLIKPHNQEWIARKKCGIFPQELLFSLWFFKNKWWIFPDVEKNPIFRIDQAKKNVEFLRRNPIFRCGF